MKKKKETIAKGIIALLFSQVLIKIIGLAYKIYLTNKEGFGDRGNAIYSAGFQIYALLLTISSIGVPNTISKIVSERLAIGDNKGAHKIFKIAFYIFAFLGLMGTIILFVGAKSIANDFLDIPEAEYSLKSLAPSIFFVSIISVIRGYFNGRQNLTVTAKSQSIEQVFKTLLTILCVEIVAKITYDNTSYMAAVANLATTIATIVSFLYIYMYYNYKRKEIAIEISQSINHKPTRIRKTVKVILKESIPISLSSLMSSFNKNIDLLTVVKILKKYIGEENAKIQYGILSGKIDTLCALPLALNVPFVTGMVPSISKSMSLGNKKQVIKKINTFLNITSIIALPCTIGMIIYSKEILTLLFPNASSGEELLKINAISILSAMLSQTVIGVLQAMGKSSVSLIAFSIGLVFKLGINIILISNPDVGIKGAAIGNIICNAIVLSIVCVYLFKEIKIKIQFKKIFLKPFFAITCMSIYSTTIKKLFKNFLVNKKFTILAILTSTTIYATSIAALRTTKKID